MKHLNKFESFRNSTTGESLRKKFDKPTAPERPFRRKLTKEESKKMYKHFQNHSWSNYIDNKGRIILGGGEEESGMFYINEEDLDKLDALQEGIFSDRYKDDGPLDKYKGDVLKPLTIEEFSNLREAMYAVKESESPSASQAKTFFSNEANFEKVVEKLRYLLTYKP